MYLEGEAFFDVARDTSKPFIVNCATFSVKALGTSFDVSCYNDDEFGLATLASGKIEVALGDQKKILSPGEQALIKEQSLSVKEVNILPYTSWMEDRLYFFNEKLESIMKRWLVGMELRCVMRTWAFGNYTLQGMCPSIPILKKYLIYWSSLPIWIFL